MALDLTDLAGQLRRFAADHNWDQFHTPKNLAMALAREVGELLAELQWLTAEQTEPERLDAYRRAAVEAEIADVLIYLVQLADRLHVDLERAITEKLESNEARYTIERSLGSPNKLP
jgi:NTP pyrophosphatase (non-canonical NTP hydrolase)